MPDIIGPRELSLKEKLKAAIQGDSKPGSVREHLANGLANLSEFTPLGVAYAKQNLESSANRGDIPGAVGAMAGMIPGPEGAAGKKAVAEALELLEEGMHPEKVHQAIVNSGRFDEEQATHILEKAHSHLVVNDPKRAEDLGKMLGNIKDRAAGLPYDATADGIHNPKLTDADHEAYSRGATSVGEDMTAEARRAAMQSRDPNAAGREEAVRDEIQRIGTRANDKVMDAEHLQEVAGGDLNKENFIRNAMDDEGGNAPEDVAMTLVDHLQQKDPKRLKQLLDDHEITSSRSQYGTEANEQSLGELTQSLAQNHSIPEMLAMHYDLDPERFKNVYEMPSGVGRSRSRPTQ